MFNVKSKKVSNMKQVILLIGWDFFPFFDKTTILYEMNTTHEKHLLRLKIVIFFLQLFVILDLFCPHYIDIYI